jgi:hypothetical protein
MQTSAAAFNHKKRLGDPAKDLADAINGKKLQLTDNGFDASTIPVFQGSNQVKEAQQVTETKPASPSTADFLSSIVNGGSRYTPIQNTEEPVQDEALQEKIKRRAKMKLIGTAIGSLGQLGGVAAGGDATRLEDGVTPWNLNQLQIADADYRDRLRSWIDRGFTVDMYNNRLQNQEASENYETGVRQDQAAQKAQYDAQLAEQRAQAALNQLTAKSAIEQREDMAKLGINPDDPTALEQFLDLNRKKFGADMNLTQARTNSYNRSNTKSSDKNFDLDAMRRGRDAMIMDEEKKLQGLDPIEDAEKIKAINERIATIRKHNPGSNELLDDDILKRASQIGNKEPINSGRAVQFDQERGFTNIPKSQDKIYQNNKKSEIEKSLETSVNQLISPSFQKMDQVSQGQIFNQIIMGLLESGEVQTEAEAEAYILEILEGNN